MGGGGSVTYTTHLMDLEEGGHVHILRKGEFFQFVASYTTSHSLHGFEIIDLDINPDACGPPYIVITFGDESITLHNMSGETMSQHFGRDTSFDGILDMDDVQRLQMCIDGAHGNEAERMVKRMRQTILDAFVLE